MRDQTTRTVSLTQDKNNQTCNTCLFYYVDSAANLEKCSRFARFVDHVINDMTKDCIYWTSVSDE